jgi:C4-dicarboxylate transporter DctQ subunit
VIGRAVGRAEEGLLALILGAMTLLTFLQVVLRYVFNSSLIWALEADTYLFAWLILIGMSYGVRAHAHIGVDLAVKALPAGPRRVAGLVAIGLCLLYAALMLYGAWFYIAKLRMLGVLAEDIPVPRWILSLGLPIGFFLLFVRLLEQAFLILVGRARGFELADEAAQALIEQGLGADDARPDPSGR